MKSYELTGEAQAVALEMIERAERADAKAVKVKTKFQEEMNQVLLERSADMEAEWSRMRQLLDLPADASYENYGLDTHHYEQHGYIFLVEKSPDEK